jgi:hypothetical protein
MARKGKSVGEGGLSSVVICITSFVKIGRIEKNFNKINTHSDLTYVARGCTEETEADCKVLSAVG